LKQSGLKTVVTSNSATFLDILKRSRHACQLIFIVDRDNLAFLVTFVETSTQPCTQRAKSARRGPRRDEDDHPEPEGHEAVIG
jgi:hypothetical protein